MAEALLALLGVVVGGLLTLGGIHLQIRNQRHLKRREEILPVAGRALRAAEDAWLAMSGRAYAYQRAQEQGDENVLFDYVQQNADALRRLIQALDEVSLMMRGLENERKELIESVRIDAIQLGEQHDTSGEHYITALKRYEAAREALQEKIRKALKTP